MESETLYTLKRFCRKCFKYKKLKKFPFTDKAKKYRRYECVKCAKIKDINYRHSKIGIISKLYSHQKETSKKRNYCKPTYTKEWLHNWLLSNPEFHRIYDIWVISNYKKDLKPSVDRKDDYLGYTEYNIQLMTWGENRKKCDIDQIEGRNNKNSKSVSQFDKEGNLIATYHSIIHASRVTGILKSGIGKCYNGKRKFSGGFAWHPRKE